MVLKTKAIERRLVKRNGRYHDGHGLYLQVLGPNNASWLLRYERGGRERWFGLGPLHTVGLKDARERARRARLKLLDGIDPIDEKRAAKAQQALVVAKLMTFKEAALAYFDQHASAWRNRKHRAQFLSTLRQYVFPQIGDLPVGAIDTGLILKCIEPHWGQKPATMTRVRGRIENVLDWATVRGYRSGDNPARWKGHLAEALPARNKTTKAHHPALPHSELPAFLAELRGRPGSAARALEFLILTAARTGEVLGAQWNEIDLDSATWTVPAGRMKAGKEHRVPLSSRAIELLKSLPTENGNPAVFVGPYAGRGMSNTALHGVLARMARRDITVHGFRSSFSDWAHEQTAFANHVIELSLAHAVGSGVERAYRRGDLFDKRRKLMQAWASYCASAPATKSGEVVPLRQVQ